MKTLKALKPEQVDESTAEVFEEIKKKVGMLPNLYAAMGNYPQLLKGFLAFEDTLKQGVFTTKENEAIALAVSQANGCDYCLAAHSTIAQMVGFSEKEVVSIRKGVVADQRLNALTALASQLTENKGKATQETIDDFISAGYTNQAFVELIGIVAIRSITNYIFTNGDFYVDFPKAAKLEESVTA